MTEKTRPKPYVYKLPSGSAWRIDWTDKRGVKRHEFRIHWPVAVETALRTWDR